jgi:hypothetical protein
MSYSLVAKEDGKIWIIDNDDGRSVTNSAEEVVAELIKVHGPGNRIFYRDTDGRWDELKHDGKRFVYFAAGAPPVPVRI